jgi:hypothetical protein
VENFEKLNPANSLWGRYYKLWSQVDTEAERFLEFERWWGGYFRMTGSRNRGHRRKPVRGQQAGQRQDDGWATPMWTCATSARPWWCLRPGATTSRRRRRR